MMSGSLVIAVMCCHLCAEEEIKRGNIFSHDSVLKHYFPESLCGYTGSGGYIYINDLEKNASSLVCL